MKDQSIPRHPSENPQVAEGWYTGKIETLEVGSYGGNKKNRAGRVGIWLQEADTHIVTNFYLPEQKWQRSFHRLCHFGSCFNVSGNEILDETADLQGRWLTVYVHTVSCKVGGLQAKWSDAVQFGLMPEGQEIADAEPQAALGAGLDVEWECG